MAGSDGIRRHVLLDHTDPDLVDEVERLARVQAGIEQRVDNLQEVQMMIDPREFGAMQADMKGLRRDLDMMDARNREILKELREISTQLSEHRGGWKTLVAIGGVLGGAVGAFATKILVALFGGPPSGG